MKKKNANKRIASEFAIGVVLLAAIVVAGAVLVKNARDVAELEKQAQVQTIQNQKLAEIANKNSEKTSKPAENDACKPHYYEGNLEVQGQFVSQEADGIVIAIRKTDASELPVSNYQPSEEEQTFKVKLVDPTDKVSVSLKTSSAKKPATLTVQGYAEVCQPLPLISLQPATVAFKKKS